MHQIRHEGLQKLFVTFLEVDLGPSQTSVMELLPEYTTIFTKSSIIDATQGPKYAWLF